MVLSVLAEHFLPKLPDSFNFVEKFITRKKKKNKTTKTKETMFRLKKFQKMKPERISSFFSSLPTFMTAKQEKTKTKYKKKNKKKRKKGS